MLNLGTRSRLALALLLVSAPAAASTRHAKARHPAAVAAMPTGDPVAGGRIYQACMGCHSLDENDVGPKHRGVVGRKAGSIPDYAYSPALRSSGILWTPQNLDRWLTGPQKLVLGAKMYFSLPKAKDRADVIAYLAKQR